MPRVLETTQVVVKNGKPHAVILDIKRYKQLLELAQEREDAAELRRIKRSKTRFRPLNDYLKHRV